MKQPFTSGRRVLAIVIAAMVATPLLSQTASAQFASTDNAPVLGWYGGLNLGQSRAKIDDPRITSSLVGAGFTVTGISDDDRDTGGKLFAGYQMNRHLAIEGGYFDLGRFGFTANTLPAGALNGSMKLRGFNIDLVGRLPVTNNLSAFARVGANRAEARDTFTGSGSVFVRNPNPSKRDTNIKYGLGLEYAFNDAVSMRLEAERYRINDAVGNDGDVDLVSVGLVYRFGTRRAPMVYTRTAPEPAREVMAVAPTPAPAPAPVIAPAPPAPAPARFEKITLSATELFAFDSATLRTPQPKLDDIARALNGNRDISNVVITGYTDRIGSIKYNQQLSERRANAVKTYLVGQSVDGARLKAIGRNEENPVVTCTDKSRPALIACLAPNRRVEVEQITITRQVQ